MVPLRDGEGVEALGGVNFAENERICTSLGVSTGGGNKGEGGSVALMQLRGLRLGPQCGEGVEGGGVGSMPDIGPRAAGAGSTPTSRGQRWRNRER
jgi:hypothetical protein